MSSYSYTDVYGKIYVCTPSYMYVVCSINTNFTGEMVEHKIPDELAPGQLNPKTGTYNSYFSLLYRNEYIVYDESQVRMRYLVAYKS